MVFLGGQWMLARDITAVFDTRDDYRARRPSLLLEWRA